MIPSPTYIHEHSATISPMADYRVGTPPLSPGTYVLARLIERRPDAIMNLYEVCETDALGFLVGEWHRCLEGHLEWRRPGDLPTENPIEEK